MTILTSRDFNHNVSKAKSLSRSEPVFITDRGTPSHFLLSYQQYELLLKKTLSNIDRLSMSIQELSQIEDGVEFERVHFSERQIEL